jgi:hypothetical protein
MIGKLFRKQLECFFCKVQLTEQNTYTLQYSSRDGLHSAKICNDCATTFDELAALKEEAYLESGSDTI